MKKQITLVTLCLIAVLVSVSACSAANLTVGTGGTYSDIQSAYDAANDGDTIIIANGTYSGTKNTGITICKNMTIQGQSQNGTIINGSGTNWIFNINSGTVTIQNLTFVNATNWFGGAIYNNYGATAIVNDCTFTGNTAEIGGAIGNDGNMTISGCTFTDNTAEYDGGAIYQCDGTMTITGCTFTGNSAEDNGGAIYIDEETTTTIIDCIFKDNTAAIGGAICNDDGEEVILKITDSTIENNKAVAKIRELSSKDKGSNYGGLGGGIYLDLDYDYSYEIIGNHFLNNVGSGIYIQKYNYLGLVSFKEASNKLLINFNRFYGNTPYGIYYNNTTEVGPYSVSAAVTTPVAPVLDVKYNWWGNNAGPNSAGADKTNLESIYYAPWIVMKLTPTKVVINGGEKTLLTASFLYDNNGTYHDPANGHIPDGTPVTFTTSLGQVGSQTITTYTVNGIATAILRAIDAAGNPVSGTALITATTDAQTLSTSVSIIEVPEANAATNTTNTTNTVGMQPTGIPIAVLILAILAVFGGLLVPKRK